MHIENTNSYTITAKHYKHVTHRSHIAAKLYRHIRYKRDMI